MLEAVGNLLPSVLVFGGGCIFERSCSLDLLGAVSFVKLPPRFHLLCLCIHLCPRSHPHSLAPRYVRSGATKPLHHRRVVVVYRATHAVAMVCGRGASSHLVPQPRSEVPRLGHLKHIPNFFSPFSNGVVGSGEKWRGPRRGLGVGLTPWETKDRASGGGSVHGETTLGSRGGIASISM